MYSDYSGNLHKRKSKKVAYAQFNFLRPAPVINDYDSMKNNSQFINAAI